MQIVLSGDVVEFPLGLFLLSTPPRHDSGEIITRQIEAYDQLQVASDHRVDNRYTVAAGTRYTDAIIQLIGGLYAGLNLVPSASTLPVALDWDPGTAVLQIVNDLLGKINYRSLFFSSMGVAQVIPYVLPDQRPIDYIYADDDLSVTLPGMDDAVDLFGVPNAWVVIVSEPDRAALMSEYANTSASSPTSTVNRGRVITKFVSQSMDAPDQTTLDALVRKMASDDSQVYRHFLFTTALMPMHEDSDVLQVQMSRLGINSRYVEQSWDMDLVAGGQMHHDARQVISV
jgi:hypothetical protein